MRADDLTDTGTCDPLRRNGSDDDSGNVFLPCGVIANSRFNGTYSVYHISGNIDSDFNLANLKI